MRLLFGTKDPQPAVSKKETWIILLSRKPKKENENTEERLAVSILLNCVLFSVQCKSNFSRASATKTKNIEISFKSLLNYLADPSLSDTLTDAAAQPLGNHITVISSTDSQPLWLTYGSAVTYRTSYVSELWALQPKREAPFCHCFILTIKE